MAEWPTLFDVIRKISEAYPSSGIYIISQSLGASLTLSGLTDDRFREIPIKAVIALDPHVCLEEFRQTLYVNWIPGLTKRGFLNWFLFLFYKNSYLKANIKEMNEF